ncbi:MAG: glutathione peroxidase [Geminicoccaceae bacterium]|nr:glutathione peroxidase [Geminicoccaceae bacterium]MCS7266451.1 glutathione peroxidase [Geminicoccaceae bacterium]MDW8123953.1 glutathione peroxidase [Geminicoccaceae bacterium]MDW8342799.1 glutathione peroxidase [Geminicoccaceae bacterium]
MRATLALLFAFLVGLAPSRTAAGQGAAGEGAYAFAFVSIEGEPLPLARFRGRPLLVVNTASLCGFTYQYAALQRLWTRYRERGLVVLAVPSNDFNQEPGTNAQIKTFCETNFALDFPMTEKVRVRGPDAHPFFLWLRRELGERAGPRWNFYKYLIDGQGRAVAVWPSSVEPEAPEIARAIERALAGSG